MPESNETQTAPEAEAIEAPVQDQPDPGNTDAPPSDGTSASEGEKTPDYFEDHFDPESLEAPLRKRYQEMQSAWTRKTQELAEQRKQAESAMALISDLQSEDPETKKHAVRWIAENFGEDAVLQALGIEVDDDGTDEDEQDKQPEFRDPRVDEILAEKQAREQQEALDALEEQIDTRISELAKQAGYELDEDEVDLIWDKVLALPPGEDGSPKVDEAFSKVTGLRQKFAPKEKPKAPSPPPNGTSGTPASVPLNDPKARRAYALEAANRAFESSQ